MVWYGMVCTKHHVFPKTDILIERFWRVSQAHISIFAEVTEPGYMYVYSDVTPINSDGVNRFYIRQRYFRCRSCTIRILIGSQRY
jgi:hypothetical protein